MATTRARALAGVWGRPAAAPEMPFDESHAYRMARDPLLPGPESGGTRGGGRRGRSSTAARGGRKGSAAASSSSVRQRSDAYARAHQHDLFTVENP